MSTQMNESQSNSALQTGAPAADAATKTEAVITQQKDSLLSQAAANNTDWLPEKYKVSKADGSLDFEASARKLGESYKHLEQRFGSGDAPPKTADEYAPKVETEGFSFDEFKKSDEAQSFLKAAHAKGINNDQLSFVLGEYYKQAPQLVAGAKELDAQSAQAELRKEWKTDAEYTAGIQQAIRTFNAYATEEEKSQIDLVGNNPLVIRLLSRIGKELKEDTPAQGQIAIQGDFNSQVAELRDQASKLGEKDPRRKQIMDQINSLYQRKFGNNKHQLGGGANIATA
jgi:hypothetical protein